MKFRKVVIRIGKIYGKYGDISITLALWTYKLLHLFASC